MANNQRYVQFLFQLGDLGSFLNNSELRDGARAILKLMPAGKFFLL